MPEMSSHNQQLIKTFYEAFAKGDAEGMIVCYHEEIVFQDPAFGILKGKEAKSMWQMLVRPGVEITFDQVAASETNGNARWEAHYVFTPTGKKVINKIFALFEFKEGKIIRHIDSFDMWKWSSQAFGLKGVLLGWTPFFQKKVQQRAKANLKAFMSSN